MNNFKYYFLLFILIYLVSLGFLKSQPEALRINFVNKPKPTPLPVVVIDVGGLFKGKEMFDRVSVYEDLDNEVTCYILDERELSCIPNQFLTKKNEQNMSTQQ